VSDSNQLWLLAGGNGAGKSTFYKTQLESFEMPFVNAHILAKRLFPNDPEQNNYQAARVAEQIREQLIRDDRSFCFETVFSHPSKIDFIAQAKTLGYEVVLVFIHLESIPLNNARITQRVDEGGHNAPEDKVNSRIPRILKNIR
jgi:predicted ABC-type ATPase